VAHSSLGELHLAQGRAADALAEFDAALRIDPQLPIHGLKSTALVALGRYGDAAAALRAGMAVAPGQLDLQRRLAWLLATCPEGSVRSGVEAVGLAEEVLALSGESAVVLDTLAAAYAEAGRFDDAVKAAERAYRLETTENRESAIEERLASFRRGMPYREEPAGEPRTD
jgi:tetratricopeptide (TPR) repeat protein